MILVTGATGRVGGEVVRLLAARGAPVRAFVRGAHADGGPAVEVAHGDFARPETLEPALEGVERVFLASSQDPRQAELQGNVVEAAARAGVKRIVKLSGIAASVAPAARTAIGRAHWETEQQIERSGIAFTLLRPNLYMQSLLEWSAPLARQTGVLAAPMGDAPIAMVDARDVAAVAVAALVDTADRSAVYEVSGPRAISYPYLAERVSAATGTRIRYVHMSQPLARRAMMRMGRPDWYADHILEIARLFGIGAGATTTQVVQQVTGNPPRTIDGFLAEQADSFRGALPAPARAAAGLALEAGARVLRLSERRRR